MKFIIFAALALPGWAFAQTSTFKVDGDHTQAVFKVDHLGFSTVTGLIGGASGKFTIDEKTPARSSFEVTLKLDTLTTLTAKRDEHLRSPDFFDSKQFPTISMKSKSVKKSGDKYDVTAELTLHGVSKTMSFTVTPKKTGQDPWKNIRSGFETSFIVQRSEFGMTYMNGPGAVGNEIDVAISVEGIKEGSK